MKIGTVADHRGREGGGLIYPVYSRRSGGLSIGVNFFPDHKTCSFNCPYCEVFPFDSGLVFSLEAMKPALESAVEDAKKKNIPIKDICFSGNGEPTMSTYFPEAVTAAAAIRSLLAPEAKLVLITNGSCLLNNPLFTFLKNSASPPVNLQIWLKLDAATEAWYRIINRCEISHNILLSHIMDFAASQVPFSIQTMLCRINGALPETGENIAWVQLVTELAKLSGAGLRAVQIYGKARPAYGDPLAEAAPLAALTERAAMLCGALEKAGLAVPVEVYE